MKKTIIFIGQTNPFHHRFDIYYEIEWAVDEDFTELIKQDPLRIADSDAEHIERIEGLSLRSKILLSAAAGAAIQYLIDNNIPFVGPWEIKIEQEA